MADRLIRPGDEGVTVTASALRTLLSSGNGDAALLYLALLRRHGGVAPRSLAGELRWDRERIERAETALQEMKLLAPEPEAEPPLPAERPAYSGTDVAEKLETSGEFRSLLAAVEQRMGKKLATPDAASLLGIDKIHVNFMRMRHTRLNTASCNFIKFHPVIGIHIQMQHLCNVPGNCLSFTVRVRC